MIFPLDKLYILANIAGMHLYDSITTSGRKIGTHLYLIEKIVLAGHKNPPPLFWTKKECKKFDPAIYTRVQILIPIFKRIEKTFGEDILVKTLKSFDRGQLKKLYLLACFYGNIGKIYTNLSWYCQDEVKTEERLRKVKDDGRPTRILFNSGPDYRDDNIVVKKKCNIWEFLKESHGTEES